MDSIFFQKFAMIEAYLTKLNIRPDSVLTVQLGTIVDTQDDLHLGRVKVKLDNRGDNTTRWCYFLGYSSGQVPIEYVRNGTRVACIAAYGNANEMLIIGTFGSGSLPNPVSLPSLSFADQFPLPICNERSVGQAFLLENKNGSDVNICVRSGSSYSWRKLHSSLITENQGYTTEQSKKFEEGIASNTLFQDSQPFSILPVCDESKQGQTIPFSERNDWRQFNVICKKDENGVFRWKPSSTLPIFTRNSLPNPTEEYHGTVVQIDDGANSYLAYCARQNGEMKWMKYSNREAISFNNITTNDRPNNKSKNSPKGAVPNPSKSSENAKAEDNPQIQNQEITVDQNFVNDLINGIVADATSVDVNKLLDNTIGVFTGSIASKLGITTSEVSNLISSGSNIANSLGIDVPSNIPTEISAVLTANSPLDQILLSTTNIVSSNMSSEEKAVLFGIVSGGWQGGIDATTTYGLQQLPDMFKGSFESFLFKNGGIDNLPGPLKDIANSALGNLNIGLKDVSKYILSGSLFNDLSNVNFDISKIDLSINPDNIGNFLKSILPGNIDLSNVKLDAGTLSKSVSAVLDYAGLGKEFSSIFSGGLGTELASLITGPINSLLASGKGPDPCPCENRKCTSFKDPINDGQSLLEDCKTVIYGMTTYNLDNATITNNNPIAEGAGLAFSGKGLPILTPDLTSQLPDFFGGGDNFIDATKAIKFTQVDDLSKTIQNGIGARGDFLQVLQELKYTGETTSKVTKVIDNNITQLEITDRQVIDGVLSILKNILGCELPGGGVLNEVNKIIQDFMSVTSTLASITNALNSITRGGLGSDIQAVIDTISTLSSTLGSINNRISSTACQIKADFIQPAKDLNTALAPGFPGGSGKTPFTQDELSNTVNNAENLSKETLISSVFDGIPNPGIGILPNRVATLSEYPNKDIVDSILNQVFSDPNGIPQTFPDTANPVINPEVINNIVDGLKPNEEGGRFTGEKDCR